MERSPEETINAAVKYYENSVDTSTLLNALHSVLIK